MTDFQPQIRDAILELHPNAKFNMINGDGWEHIEWKDENIAKPTESEVSTRLAKLIAEFTANQYQRDMQYPQLGEQLDLLFHDMTAGKGTKTGEWYKAVAKVKADNPKG